MPGTKFQRKVERPSSPPKNSPPRGCAAVPCHLGMEGVREGGRIKDSLDSLSAFTPASQGGENSSCVFFARTYAGIGRTKINRTWGNNCPGRTLAETQQAPEILDSFLWPTCHLPNSLGPSQKANPPTQPELKKNNKQGSSPAGSYLAPTAYSPYSSPGIQKSIRP